MGQHIHTSRAILLLHTLYPDWRILDEVGRIIPNFDTNYFQSVAFGLQQAGLLRYSTVTQRREVTDKGKNFAQQVADTMRRELNMHDTEFVHALIDAIAWRCREEQAQWMRERQLAINAQ